MLTTKDSARRAWRQRRNTLLRTVLAPPPRLSISEWADRYRVLSRESSAEPGKWTTDRAPYQRGIMDAFGDPMVEGVVVMSSAQIGKALALDTPLPTPAGWTTMGDIRAGDVLFDEVGRRCRVTFATEVMHGRPCYRVVFSDGSEIVADAEHRWYVESDTPISKGRPWGGAGPRSGVLTTREIAETAKYGARGNRNRYAIPVASAIEAPEADLPVDPYVLGVWLGDGNSNTAQVTLHREDLEVADHIRGRGVDVVVRQIDDRAVDTMNLHLDPLNGTCTRGHEASRYRNRHGGCRECARLAYHTRKHGAPMPGRVTMHARLDALGVLGRKHIPPAYLRSSPAQRLALLQGLMDADGTIGGNGRCEFVTTCPELAAGFAELLASLGIKHTAADKQPRTRYKGRSVEGRVARRFSFLVYSDTPVFQLRRKRDRQVGRDGRRVTETERRRIVAVEPVESVPVRCIQVDSPSHLFLAGRSMIPTHNTEILNNVVAYYIDQDPAPTLVLHPTQQMGEAWSKDRLAPMLRDTPRLHGKVKDPRARDSGNTLLHKALALETPLPTASGWTTVGEVRVGDTLFDERGQPCRVTDLTPIYHDRPCYRVRFSDGEEIVADAGHIWSVERWVVKKRPQPHQEIARELLTTADLVGRVSAGNRFRYAVPTTGPLHTPETVVPLPPYALGVWLGDGYSHRAAVVMQPADAKETVEYLRAEGLAATIRPISGRGVVEILLEPLERNTRRGPDGRMQSATEGVRGALRAMGLISRAGSGRSRKRIPAAYLRAGESQRRALLQGLMDTDGSITPQGWCRFVTVLPDLANGFEELLSTLGIKWTRKLIAATGAHLVSFQAPGFSVFQLARKRERQRPPTTGATRRRIVAVEPVPSVPVRCITVDSPEHLFLAGRRMVPTHNSFPGGHITISGANSAASLASRPIRIVLCDEVDRYPASAGTEGDPVGLAFKRTATFWNRKKGMWSTPTIKGFSRIEAAFEESDQRHYHVPCPECGHMQTLRWSNLKWESGDPDTAMYCCDECGVLIEEQFKMEMLSRGVWVASNPGHRTAGFHINALYSPWARWADLVREFLESKGNPERLKVWVNTVLGETWEEAGERVNPESLVSRREKYRAVCPEGVGILTAAVDTQGDRLEVKVKGWGKGEESWLIHYEQIFGDPGREDVWMKLEEVLTRAWPHESGAELRIEACCVDSGGHHTESVYRFVKPRQSRRVWAIKGANQPGRPLVGRFSKANKHGVRLLTIGTDTAKDAIFSRLKVSAPGPLYMHFPDWVDEEYFAQLTSEKVVTRYSRGRPIRSYEKTRPRNEALDLEVYALAALISLGTPVLQNLGTYVDRVNEEGAKKKSGTDGQPVVRRSQRRPKGWVSSWR